MSIVRHRDQIAATMATDFGHVIAVLRIIQDRALTGTPLHLQRPPWFSPTADIAHTMRNSIYRMIDDIFSTAVVDEPTEPANAAE